MEPRTYFSALVITFACGVIALFVATDSVSSEIIQTIVAALGVLIAFLVSRLAVNVESTLSEIRVAERQPPAPDTGVLICNAVDEKTLLSVARQVKAELLPTRSERKRTKERRGTLSVPLKWLHLGGSRSRSHEDTETFEDTNDTNVLLGRALRALNEKKALRRDLVRVPALAIEPDDRFEDSQTIDRVLRNALAHKDLVPQNILVTPTKAGEKSTPDAIVQTEGVTFVVDIKRLSAGLSETLRRDVPLQRVAESLRQRWSDAADGRFVLVEGPWDIEQVDGGLLLKLAALTVEEDGSTRERPLDMPDGLAVECRVPVTMLLDNRTDRLRADRRMALGVFGVVSHPTAGNDGTLTLEPTAVFERLATPS